MISNLALKTVAKSLTLAMVLFASNSFALEVEAQKLELSVEVKAKNYADVHDSSNEYKVDFSLQDKTGKHDGYPGPIIGVLKISDSQNARLPFSKYETLRLEESFKRKTTIVLPTKTLEDTVLRLRLHEADFSIPFPGPCCILINDDDLELDESVDLIDGSQELTYQTPSAEVKVTIQRVKSFTGNLTDIVNEQLDFIHEDSLLKVGTKDETFFRRHIMENL